VKKLFKIGIWHYKGGSYANGGAFAYTQALQEILINSSFPDIEIVHIGYNIDQISALGSNVLSLTPIHSTKWPKLLNSLCIRLPLYGMKLSYKIKKNYNNKLINKLKRAGIEVIYYINPGIEIDNFPHISTLWDLGHISMFAFPEVSMHGKLESRIENLNRDINKALVICAESEAGKKELIRYCPVNPDRIHVIPMIPGLIVKDQIVPERIDFLANDEFFIYPAKYWPHKNHYNLLLAFKKFTSYFPSVKLVFTGANQNNIDYVNHVIQDLGLENDVIQLGVVNLQQLKWLYKNAVSLVMPTFLGPTNMPLVEAYYLGCKVICSRLDGHIEQLGEAARYFDPLDPDEIFAQMKNLYEESTTNQQSAVEIHYDETATIAALTSLFLKAKHIKRTWGTVDEIS
jgi:glycosyltransferase involved in cell wall biosynthesis